MNNSNAKDLRLKEIIDDFIALDDNQEDTIYPDGKADFFNYNPSKKSHFNDSETNS
jgi:hypothetical protein